MKPITMLVVAIFSTLAATGVSVGQTGPDVDAPIEELMGCVTGGNLQPAAQPFVLEAAEAFVLAEVIRRDASLRLVSAPTDYRISGIDVTPWLGMRVRVEGVVVDPHVAPQPLAAIARPEIKAVRVTSIWGTCASRASWTPVP
jgi:hypothetical protein